MPLDLLKELIGHYRAHEAWLREQVAACESGQATHGLNGRDDTKEFAADLKHRAANIAAMIEAYERLAAKRN